MKVNFNYLRLVGMLAVVVLVVIYGNVLQTHSSALPQPPDTTPPTCTFTSYNPGPPAQFQITAQDTESGLNTIAVVRTMNAAVTVPPFAPGTTAPVVVTATKSNSDTVASVELQITDVAGNVTRCEVDQFAHSEAKVTLSGPLFPTHDVQLNGPTTVVVDLGSLADTDSDGREQVKIEMVQLELMGTSPFLGPVNLNLRPVTKHPFQRTLGEIEETANTQSGRLDLPPFAPSGSADSFFDVFFEVTALGQTFHNHTPPRMSSVITKKPPDQSSTYTSPNIAIELFDEAENPTGIFLTHASHVPNRPPTCVLTAIVPGPPTQIKVTARDIDSGLDSITVLSCQNCTASYPPFTPGTNDPVVVTATKTNQNMGAVLTLKVEDVAGNVTPCDPVVLNFSLANGKPKSVTVTDIPQEENKIRIMNGNPGLKKLKIVVNGVKFKVKGLRNNEERTVDISSAMVAGSNTIKLTADGKAGANAVVIIQD